jgi:hypothetical protein
MIRKTADSLLAWEALIVRRFYRDYHHLSRFEKGGGKRIS